MKKSPIIITIIIIIIIIIIFIISGELFYYISGWYLLHLFSGYVYISGRLVH